MGCTAAGDDVCVQLPPWRCGHQRIHQAVPVRHVAVFHCCVSMHSMFVRPTPLRVSHTFLSLKSPSPDRSNHAHQNGMQRRAISMMASGSMRGNTGHACGDPAPAWP